jgi:hypothetical protein
MRGVVIATVAFATALAAGVTLERVHLARAMPTPADPVGYEKTFTERFLGNTTIIPKSVKPVVLRRAWGKGAEEDATAVLDRWLAWSKTYPRVQLAAMDHPVMEQAIKSDAVLDKPDKSCGSRRHKRFYNHGRNTGRSWRCSRGRS